MFILKAKVIGQSERFGVFQNGEDFMDNKKSDNTRLIFAAKRLAFILTGTYIMSIAINALYLPHNILSGGITGISLLFHLLFDIDASIIIIVFNIPIFILGYFFVNHRFVLWSLVGMGSLSFFLWLTKSVTFYSTDLMTTILLGGVIYGLGFGLVFRGGASCGGNDIVSKIINNHFSFSIPTINFAFNVIVVALSVYFFGIDAAVRTLATLYIASVVMKFVMEGINYKRTAFIISDKKQELAKEINTKLRRGCTIVCGTGGYTGATRNMLYCVIGIHQLAKLKMLVSQIDPRAFINIVESKAVFGNGRGFIHIEDEDK